MGPPRGSWGFPEGGMGGVTAAMRAAAEHFGATVRVGAEVAKIKVHDGRVTGVTIGPYTLRRFDPLGEPSGPVG